MDIRELRVVQTAGFISTVLDARDVVVNQIPGVLQLYSTGAKKVL